MSYALGLFGAEPSSGLSMRAWMTVTRPVVGSFSNDVAITGYGNFIKPTDFPGAMRK